MCSASSRLCEPSLHNQFCMAPVRMGALLRPIHYIWVEVIPICMAAARIQEGRIFVWQLFAYKRDEFVWQLFAWVPCFARYIIYMGEIIRINLYGSCSHTRRVNLYGSCSHPDLYGSCSHTMDGSVPAVMAFLRMMFYFGKIKASLIFCLLNV